MELIKGCTVDGDCTTCVFDDPEYKISDCRVASRLFDEGKGRDACPDWKPTADEKHAQAHIIAECESLRAEIAQLTAERDRLKDEVARLTADNAGILRTRRSINGATYEHLTAEGNKCRDALEFLIGRISAGDPREVLLSIAAEAVQR